MKKLPLIFGLSGPSLTTEEKKFFTEKPIFGFILFKRNIESKEQLLELTKSLKSLYTDKKPLIFIDQEGGRVARLKPPIINNSYPPASKLKNTVEVKNNYEKIMADLQDFGIDSPCAPVVDLEHEEAHNVIGDRSFGSDVRLVVVFAKEAINAIKNKGGIPVIKHIPGHGRAKADSHHELPIVEASLDELNKTDFKVFKELANTVDYAMTAHIKYKALDAMNPITLSKEAINFIKKEIGFKGKLITDAIEMLALHPGVDPEDKEAFADSLAKVAAQSLAAGCDLVLHCTGNLEQMQKIAGAIPETYYFN